MMIHIWNSLKKNHCDVWSSQPHKNKLKVYQQQTQIWLHLKTKTHFQALGGFFFQLIIKERSNKLIFMNHGFATFSFINPIAIYSYCWYKMVINEAFLDGRKLQNQEKTILLHTHPQRICYKWQKHALVKHDLWMLFHTI